MFSCLIALFIVFTPLSFAINVDSENPRIKITMDKIWEIDVVVKKREVSIAGDSIGMPEALNDEEEVLLSLIRIKEDPSEEDFEQFLDYKNNNTENKINLVPGDYVISGQFLVNKNITIPGRIDTYCKGVGQQDFEQTSSTFVTAAGGVIVGAAVASVISAGVTGGLAAAGGAITGLGSFAGVFAALGTVGWVALGVLAVWAIANTVFECIGTPGEIEIPELSMDPAILGGLDGNITITDDIYSNDKITFYVFSSKPPLVIEELNFLGMIEDISNGHPDMIRPDLS